MLHPSTFIQFAGLAPHRRPHRHRAPFENEPVLIRHAATADEPAIARLAVLDELPELPGDEHLVGELGGRIVAALDVRSGRTVADPFVPTTGVVALLGLRAAQVRR